MILRSGRRIANALFANNFVLCEWSFYFKQTFTTSEIAFRRGIKVRDISVSKTEFPLFDPKLRHLKLSIPNANPTEATVPTTASKVEKKMLHDDSVSDLDENDKRFSKIVTQQRLKKQREGRQQVLLKGTDLIQIALSKGATLEYLFHSKHEALRCLDTSNLCASKVLKVRDRLLRSLSGNRDSHNVVALCSISTLKINNVTMLPVTIVCNNIRDPDNLGAVVSLGAATGCKSILLTEGCADVWEHKVMSAAGGAHFYIPIQNNIKWSEVRDYLPQNCAFYIADSSSDITLEDNHVDQICDGEEFSDIDFLKHRQLNIAAPSNPIETDVKIYENFEMPCHLYCSIEFPKEDIVIFMGGETHGVDGNVEQLGLELRGEKIKIPLENGMDSLNVSAALSILLFEIKRQFKKNVRNYNH